MKDILKEVRPIHWGLFAIWLFALVSAIFRPLLNDNMVFFAWAQQVYDSSLSGIDAIESVWEIKGLFSRIIYYQLYWFTQLFCSTLWPNGQYIYQAIGYTEICLIIILSLYFLPKEFLSPKEKTYSFFIITFAFFVSTPIIALQSEQWGICFLLLSMALLLRGKAISSIIGGLILGATFFIKTPLLLLSGSVFFAYMLIKRLNLISTIKEMWLYALSALIGVISILGLLYLFYPIEIQDIRDASYYQSSLLSYDSLIYVIRDFGHSIANMWQMPVYLPIILLGALSAIIYISSRSLSRIATMLALWLFPFLYVVISNRYAQYHFITFLFPAFACIYLIKDEIQLLEKKQLLIFCVVSVILGVIFSFKPCYFLIRLTGEYLFVIPYIIICLGLHQTWKYKALVWSICFSVFIFVSWNSIVSHSHRREITDIDECLRINAENNHFQNQIIENNDSVLTLDGGSGHLWIANASYLRYFYPLPLQRTSDNSEFMLSQTYIQTRDKVLHFQGNIILMDTAWFYSNSKQTEIREFIDSNFYIADSIMDICNSGYNIYAKDPTSMGTLYIYKRKE